MAKLNDYGLTAGCSATAEKRARLLFDCIQAGVTYVNRARRDHRCMARRAIVRRLESQRLSGQSALGRITSPNSCASKAKP